MAGENPPPPLEGLGREADQGWGEGFVPELHRNFLCADPSPQPPPSRGGGERCVPAPAYGASLEKMIVPEAANMPPTPWQTEIFAPGICAGAMPRICRTLSCSAYMPYMPECM